MRQDETEMVDTWHELQAQYGDKVTAAKIKDVVQRKLKQEVAREHIPEPAITPAIPIGKYRCIVIDPPWPMVKIEREERPNQGVTLDYPVMSLEEIAALPIPEMAEQSGCHVYLWVTQKYLPEGLRIFEAWGVKYQCVMTWVKNVGFTPFSWMYSTEHVLFGRIGSLDLLRLGMRLDFSAKVNGHSVKPDVFYTTVIDASPEPRLEMFARQRRDGFTPWGNEI
jgi:N6-adenosine-specific RNA methylase IME4